MKWNDKRAERPIVMPIVGCDGYWKAAQSGEKASRYFGDRLTDSLENREKTT